MAIIAFTAMMAIFYVPETQGSKDAGMETTMQLEPQPLPQLPTASHEVTLEKIIAYYRHYYPQALADYLVEELVLPYDTQKMERRFFSALVPALAAQDLEERTKALVISWNHMVQTVYVAMDYVCAALRAKAEPFMSEGCGQSVCWVCGKDRARALYEGFRRTADSASDMAQAELRLFKANGGAYSTVCGASLATFADAIEQGKNLLAQLDLTKAVIHQADALADKEERWRGLLATGIFLVVYALSSIVFRLISQHLSQ